MVEWTPYASFEAERQPSPDHQISQHINGYLQCHSSSPTMGVNQATTMAEPAVPHCNTMARNEANRHSRKQIRPPTAAGCPGVEGSTILLQLTPIANAITLVGLLVSINHDPIHGSRVER